MADSRFPSTEELAHTEITPAMVDAGVLEMYNCGIGEPSYQACLPDALAGAYRVMARVAAEQRRGESMAEVPPLMVRISTDELDAKIAELRELAELLNAATERAEAALAQINACHQDADEFEVEFEVKIAALREQLHKWFPQPSSPGTHGPVKLPDTW